MSNAAVMRQSCCRNSPREGLGQHRIKSHAQPKGGSGGAQERDGQSEEHGREYRLEDGSSPCDPR